MEKKENPMKAIPHITVSKTDEEKLSKTGAGK